MRPKVTLARELAYDAFVEVMEQGLSPEEVTAAMFRKHSLSRSDRGLIKEILYGGLRWFSKIFWIVQNTANRDLGQTSPQIRSALVLGTYQIFYMDRIPDRAAVNESVEYVKKKGQKGAVNFVNGVLRSIARRAEYFAKPDKDKKPVEYLALQYAHPKWMVERWSRQFGFDRVKGILASNNQPPPLMVRINSSLIPQDGVQDFRSSLLREEKTHTERRPLRSCMVLKESPNLESGGLFSQGFFTIQNEASQLVGCLVAPEPGQVIIDACAAPGGKSTHLAERMEGRGHLYVIDKSADRLEMLKENFARLKLAQPQVICGDFLDFSPDKEVDKVLLDAPCSGLGVVRRHPEGKWHKKPSIVEQMAQVQKDLLMKAFGLLGVGGELIYSVCSFEPEETVDHLRWLKREFADKIEVVPPTGRIPDYYRRFVTRDDCLVIYSGNKDAMDGFGAFILRRTAS